jgi:hypothetical protein
MLNALVDYGAAPCVKEPYGRAFLQGLQHFSDETSGQITILSIAVFYIF